MDDVGFITFLGSLLMNCVRRKDTVLVAKEKKKKGKSMMKTLGVKVK